MNIPANLKYTKTHEWVKDLGNGLFEIGLSDYAQKQLGDIVFVNLPQPGDAITDGQSFTDLESVKAVSDINSCVTGTIKEVNETLSSTPDSINKAPYDTWIIRVEGTLGAVLTAGEYEKTI